jgi:hypothetical protein
MRLDIALGGAVLLVLLLVGRHLGSSGTAKSTNSSPPSVPTATSTSHSLGPQQVAVFPVPDRRAGNAAHCPDGFACPVSRGVTAGTRAALDAAFPGARVISARTVRTVVAGYGQSVWTMDVRARADGTEIRLRVQPLSPEDKPQHGTTLFNGHALTHWESALSQMLVVIDVIGPADVPPPLAAMDQLAHDARMLSPW